VLAAYALFALAMAFGTARLTLDNSAESFFVRDAGALERYRRFEHEFGRDRALRIAIRGPRLWSREGLAWAGRVENEAAALPGVHGAAGLRRHHGRGDSVWPPPDPAAFRRTVAADPLDRNAGWAGRDGEAITVLVALYRLDPGRQRRVLAGLERLLAEPPPGVAAELVGLPVLQRALDREIADFATRFMPALALLGTALLAAVFRRPADVLAPLALVAVTELAVFGAMGWLGIAVDVVTFLLAPLLFVVALATGVHVVARFRALRRSGRDAAAAVLATYRDKGWPVFWAGVTTCAGFGSLAISPVPPVRALGACSALGFAFMTLAAVTLLPALLAGGGRRAGDGAEAGVRGAARRRRAAGAFERWAARRGRRWAAWAVRRPAVPYALFGAAAALALAGGARLEVGGDFRSHFRPGHPVRAGLERLERAGIGPVAADLVVTRGRGPRFDTPEGLVVLAHLGAALREEDQVLGVVTGADLATAVARNEEPADAVGDTVGTGEPAPPDGHAPPLKVPDRLGRALERMRTEPDLDRLRASLLAADGGSARVMLLVPMAGFDRLEPMLERGRLRAERIAGAEAWITGAYPLVLAAQRSLLSTMVLSLTLTALAVAAVLRLLLGSARAALAALVPNLWPVLFVLGAMGWLRVPVDSTTVMIAAVTLGLAVDDTLHSLGYFRRALAARGEGRRSAPAAAVRALGRGAPALILTTALLVAGFGVCALSSFLPVARFGALTALALLAALAADLLLLAALLGALPARAAARLRDRGLRRRGAAAP
jgi:hypothetical protein